MAANCLTPVLVVSESNKIKFKKYLTFIFRYANMIVSKCSERFYTSADVLLSLSRKILAVF